MSNNMNDDDLKRTPDTDEHAPAADGAQPESDGEQTESRPPRVVSEAPLGGVSRPVSTAAPESPAAGDDDDRAEDDMSVDEAESAAELAAQIPAPRVAGMREEAYPAVATPHRAVPQIRAIPQRGIQRDLILTNERLGAIVLVPILAKSKNFRDGYGKSTRFSVTMLIVVGTSSSYPLDAHASRPRTRIFYALPPKSGNTHPYNQPTAQSHPDRSDFSSPLTPSVYPT